MKRFVVGFCVCLIVMVSLGWLFKQSVFGGWGPSEPAPAWLQSVGLLAWLLFSSGVGYVLVPAVGGALWAWLGQSKSGRFSGMVRWKGDPTDGRGCQIFPNVTIGGVAVGTAVVPDALLEQWRYPSPTVTGNGTLDVLKIGRCVVALNSARGCRSAWGIGAIHKAYPFLAMAFFAITVVSMGAGFLVTYLPVYLWGSVKVAAFRGVAKTTRQVAT